MQLYLDTSALIALGDRRDGNHERAVAFLKDRLSAGAVFVTGRHVIIEYIDGVAKRVSKEKAVKELGNLLESRFVFVEDLKSRDWEAAMAHFEKPTDKVDLTDALSFALMERLKIKDAFTFDSDFAAHGFIVVPQY